MLRSVEFSLTKKRDWWMRRGRVSAGQIVSLRENIIRGRQKAKVYKYIQINTNMLRGVYLCPIKM